MLPCCSQPTASPRGKKSIGADVSADSVIPKTEQRRRLSGVRASEAQEAAAAAAVSPARVLLDPSILALFLCHMYSAVRIPTLAFRMLL